MKNGLIFTGEVSHLRILPKRHTFTYGIALFYIDLDEAHHFPSLPPFFSFNEEDYLKKAKRPGEALQDTIRRMIFEKTGEDALGPICLLTQIRYFGVCFNPVNFYYCFDEAREKVKFIVAEITNTPWLEREVYVLKCGSSDSFESFRFPKNFHVSPFMPMDVDWHWKFEKPQGHNPTKDLTVQMENRERNNLLSFITNLSLRPMPLTRTNILKVIALFPLLTLKPIIAIYYEALRLKLKGLKFYEHPNEESRL